VTEEELEVWKALIDEEQAIAKDSTESSDILPVTPKKATKAKEQRRSPLTPLNK